MTPQISAVQQLVATDPQLRLAIKNWKRKQRRAIIAAEQTIENARAPSTHLISIQRARDAITKVMGLYGSHERLPILLDLLERAPDELFWHALLTEWPRCDANSHYQDRLLQQLKDRSIRSNCRVSLQHEARAFLDALPAPIRVYRGCSRLCVTGIAWTTDRCVAEGFARGHRGIPVPDAILAEADIPKSAVFAVVLERDESEVLLNPGRVRSLSLRAVSNTPC